MSEIEFRDPPKKPGRWGGWGEILAPLEEHPGRWAMVSTRTSEAAARAVVQNLRRGRTRTRPGKWEYENGGAEVFARYMGPEGEA